MLILRDPRQTQGVRDASLQRVLEERFLSLTEDESLDPNTLGQIVVLEDGDSLDPLVELLGFSPLENRLSGAHFGQAEFSPSFELIEDHQCCFEIVFVLSDDGYGVLVFVPKDVQLDPRLFALCERYAMKGKEPAKP